MPAAAMRRACENSLRRLQTDYLDMYLLHWRGDIPLQETVEAMERLVARVKSAAGASPIWTPTICRRCGGRRVANAARPIRCSIISRRGALNTISALVPAAHLPVMAYCPLAQAGRLRDGLFQHTDIINMANERGVTARSCCWPG
jgi:diketogulonate reductase-like aldo/keto reductase